MNVAHFRIGDDASGSDRCDRRRSPCAAAISARPAAPTNGLSWPHTTQSNTSGEAAATACARKVPTLNPGAAVELEVLGHAAVEDEALRGIVLVDELRGVAEASR